jgi:hypothetical protein
MLVPPAANRRTNLKHNVPKVRVELAQLPDGSIVFSGVAYRFLTAEGDPYEYTITVAPQYLDAIRVALGAQPDQEAFDAIVAHSAEIMDRGEIAWLDSLGVQANLDCWEPWVDIVD